MRPSDQAPTGAATEAASPDTARFTCACGRSVCAPAGSAADESRKCTSCRAHAVAEDSLVRTT